MEMARLDENRNVVLIDSVTDIPHNWRDESSRVGLDDVEGVIVSTVFLGINHGFGQRPLWFETLVGGENIVARYETWDEATKGHIDAVRDLTEQRIEILRELGLMTK